MALLETKDMLQAPHVCAIGSSCSRSDVFNVVGDEEVFIRNAFPFGRETEEQRPSYDGVSCRVTECITFMPTVDVSNTQIITYEFRPRQYGTMMV